MTNDNKPPIWMAATDVSSLADKKAAADTFIGNCTTNIPFKFEFPPENACLSVPPAPPLSPLEVAMLAAKSLPLKLRPSLLPLSAPSQFEASVLMALGCQRNLLEADGVSLSDIARVLGMESTPEGDRRILDALQQLKRLVPALAGLRYSESDGLVRTGDGHQ